MADKIYKPKKEEIKTQKTGTNFSVNKNGNGKKKSYDEYSKEDFVAEIEQLKKRKKYGLVWEEQEEKFDKDTIGKLPVLKEVKNREIKTDKNSPVNLLIEGDNYHSLSVLNYTHEKAVDVIYIDPPYNTGNKDFKYNDIYIEKDDAYRHSKWLSFISKRIKLSKNLLKDSGVIFISINENEFAQLKLLCDDIFDESNYLTTFTIKVRHEDRILKGDKDFHEVVEYLLLYRKSATFKPLKRKRENTSGDEYIYEVKELIKSPKKILMGSKIVEIFKPGQYEIAKIKPTEKGLKKINIRGSIKEGNSSGRFYMRHINSFARDNKDYLLKVPEIGDDWLGFRYFLTPRSEKQANGHYFQGVPLTRIGNSEKPYPNFFDFVDEFNNVGYEGGIDFRNGKKPIVFIEKLLEIANCNVKKEAVILDFFAGSGSTGHALLDFNENFGGSRRFILCTNNESNIATEICYPRIKNIILGRKSQQKLDGNLKYFKTSFVDATPTDENKKKLTDQSTEMLCVRENTFDEVLNKKDFKIFKNDRKHTGIVFDQSAIADFKKEARKIKGPIHTYIFSLEDEDFAPEFEDMDGRIIVSPIPEAILRVYRRIFSIKI